MITKKEKVLIFILFLSIIFSISLTANFYAIKDNDCKMPVKFNNCDNINMDSTHSCFVDNSEVNLWFLTDIINLDFINYKISVGDIGLVLSYLLMITLLIYYYILDRKDDKWFQQIKEEIEDLE